MKGYRTLAFNSVIAVGAVLQAADWVQIVPAQYVPVVVAAVGAANLFLRMITNTPVGNKQ